MTMKDYILIKDVNYFGRIIKKGSTFKQVVNNSDWFDLWENNGGVLMHCPAISLFFTSFNSKYFIRQYDDPKKESRSDRMKRYWKERHKKELNFTKETV